MTQFQLVFRDGDGERSELRDNNSYPEPHIDGKLVVDGESYLIRGVEWILRREDLDGLARFVCTLAVEASEDGAGPNRLTFAQEPISAQREGLA